MVQTSAPLQTLDAEWVVTMAGPALRRGRLVVDGGRIAAVGTSDAVPLRGRHRRLERAVLLPGLVNAHCHLELSVHHGALPPADLWSWLPRLVALRLAPGAAPREQAAVPAAVRSMLATGTTCVGDISRAAWLPATLAGEPIRKVCYAELISGALTPPADIPQLRQRLAQLPSDPLLAPGISPHAPYTVVREDLQACAAMAARRGLPLAIHLAESREEIEWLRSGTGTIQRWHDRFFEHPPRSPRCGPAEYALAAGLAGTHPTALIHMNHADDWQRLCDVPADRRPVVVYCPRSHAYFGHQRPHPFREMLAARLAVALGTDSAASHAADEPRPLSVLDELRWLRAAEPGVPAMTLLEMATIHGAAALGLSDRIGRIAPGLQADLVAICPDGPIEDPAEALLRTRRMPSFVCVAGREIDCAIAGIDR